MNKLISGLLVLGMLSLANVCFAQGILIGIDSSRMPLPRPIQPPVTVVPTLSYKIKQIAVDARIQDQLASVQVTQSFVNTGSATIEASFCFPLPYDGAVHQMTLMVDGKEYAAKLLPAKDAKEIYLSHVRRNQDPALLEWIGTGMFQTSVFPIPPGAERTVTIQLTQLLRKTDRLTDFLYPLSTAKFSSQPVESLSFTASIESTAKIKSVYSPTHAVDVQRPDDFRAKVSFQAMQAPIDNDFRLLFDTADSEVGASLISYRPSSQEDGYFLLLASPQVKSPSVSLPPKTVIFVVDRSGSMSGKKIKQAKDALHFVLNNLNEGDLFNIVAYDNNIESFRPELQKYTDTTRAEALGWASSIYAGGSTNISGALTTAMKMIQDAQRPSYIVFLTDGLPTAGETSEMKLAAMVRQSNVHRTRLVSLGVGYDVNSRLLDRLSRDNFGLTEFVRPDEDIEMYVSRLYRSISAPVMTDIHFSVELDETASDAAPSVNRVYPRTLIDLFAGQQLVLVGRYRSSGSAKIVVTGSVGQTSQRFEFPAQLTDASTDQSFVFVESLWAIRRIGEIIDELDLSGSNQELIDELVALATKHGIVTPYTSFLADDSGTVGQLADTVGNARLARELIDSQLSQTEGQFAFEQRAAKNLLRESNQVGGGAAFGMGGMGAPSSRSPGQKIGSGTLGGNFRNLPNRPGANLDSNLVGSEPTAVKTVQSVGNSALFKRGNLWVAENARDIDPEKDQARINVIDRFSDEYFQLISMNTSSENAILAVQQASDQLLLRLRGECYLIR